MIIQDKTYTDTEVIEAMLDTSLQVAEGEEFVTLALKRVASNKKFKATFLKVLNDNKKTLALEELTVFKKQVHKMQKLCAKKPTQKAIMETLKLDAKTVKYTIRTVNKKDIEAGTHTEDQRGQYFEFISDKPPVEEPKPKPLIQVIADWQEANEPDGLAHPDRKAYDNQLLEAKAYLFKITEGMTVSKK